MFRLVFVYKEKWKDGVAYSNYLVMYPGEQRIQVIRTPYVDNTAIKVAKSDLELMRETFEREGWVIEERGEIDKRVKKLYGTELYDYLNKIRNNYYDFCSYKIVEKSTGKTYTGTLYKLERQFTKAEAAWLDKYDNILTFGLGCTYAPEIQRDAVWLGDTCLDSKKQRK